MTIIGCDYHPSFHQIAMLDLGKGDYVELRLLHAGGEAQGLIRVFERAGASGSGKQREQVLVRAAAAEAGA